MKIKLVKTIIDWHPQYCMFSSTVLDLLQCITWIFTVPDDMEVSFAFKILNSILHIMFCYNESKQPLYRHNSCQRPISITLALEHSAVCRITALQTSWCTRENNVNLVRTRVMHCGTGKIEYGFWTKLKTEHHVLLAHNQHSGRNENSLYLKKKNWLSEPHSEVQNTVQLQWLSRTWKEGHSGKGRLLLIPQDII